MIIQFKCPVRVYIMILIYFCSILHHLFILFKTKKKKYWKLNKKQFLLSQYYWVWSGNKFITFYRRIYLNKNNNDTKKSIQLIFDAAVYNLFPPLTNLLMSFHKNPLAWCQGSLKVVSKNLFVIEVNTLHMVWQGARKMVTVYARSWEIGGCERPPVRALGVLPGRLVHIE